MFRQESCATRILQLGKIFLLLLIPLAIVPILSGWVGEIAKHWILGTKVLSSADYWVFFGGLFGMLTSVVLIVWQGRALIPTRVVEQTPSFQQRQVVIALLSPCENLQQTEGGQWEVRDQRAKGASWVSLADKTLEQLIAKKADVPQWKWQQTLRGANYHRNRLKKLVLVGSLGARGSGTKEQLDLACRFLSTWFPGKVQIYGSPSEPDGEYDTRWQADFEDLSGLSNLLRNILRELNKDSAGFTDRDIVIDCTGGFKVASIAAAMVTLDHPKLMFQYVGTAEHTGQIIGFDVTTDHYST